MSLIRKQFYIDGMTCINCENKIAKRLRGMTGIQLVAVSYSKKTAKITYDADLTSLSDIFAVIENLGYEPYLPGQKQAQPDMGRTACLIAIIILLYIILQRLDILNLLAPSQLADTKMEYGMLFVIGLITSVHCIAMCGGIHLTQCLPKREDLMTDQKKISIFRSSFLYNLGRILSYTLIGFILGFLGMAFGTGVETGLSNLMQGILKLIAGIFMLVMGLNMLDIFPWLRRLNPAMPDVLARIVGRQKSKSRQPFIVGMLNGLMPCGPLQAMQIVALASANPFSGALSMFLFSLGTVPFMLGFGSIVSALGKKFTQKVMNVGAVLVVVLGLAMLSQGGSLSGLLSPDYLLLIIVLCSILGIVASIPVKKTSYKAAGMIVLTIIGMGAGMMWDHASRISAEKNAASDAEKAVVTENEQVIKSTLTPGSYPNITVQAGIPVKWMIDAPSGSINGCNYKMILEEYGIEYSFEEGENVILFTPTETGSYDYTCWMGMIHGNIFVTDEGSVKASVNTVEDGSEDRHANDGYDNDGSEDRYDNEIFGCCDE